MIEGGKNTSEHIFSRGQKRCKLRNLHEIQTANFSFGADTNCVFKGP